MAIAKRLTKRGFTLIELMIVVVIIGVLASLAIYGVQRYVANAKTAEARTMLGRMSKDQLSVFEGETMVGGVLAVGTSRDSGMFLCASTGLVTVPAALTAVANQKYQPDADEWKWGDKDNNLGWACLGTSITTPIYYMYSFESSTTAGATEAERAGAGDTVNFIAQSDFDADGAPGTIQLDSVVVLGADNSLQLSIAPAFTEIDPEE